MSLDATASTLGEPPPGLLAPRPVERRLTHRAMGNTIQTTTWLARRPRDGHSFAGDVTDVSTPGRTEAARQPSSIERIQRLERLERERLEEKSRIQERRRQAIAGARPAGGRNDLVDDIERVTKYPMAMLGIAWLVIAIVIGGSDERCV
jgi:hypothetical protein